MSIAKNTKDGLSKGSEGGSQPLNAMVYGKGAGMCLLAFAPLVVAMVAVTKRQTVLEDRVYFLALLGFGAAISAWLCGYLTSTGIAEGYWGRRLKVTITGPSVIAAGVVFAGFNLVPPQPTATVTLWLKNSQNNPVTGRLTVQLGAHSRQCDSMADGACTLVDVPAEYEGRHVPARLEAYGFALTDPESRVVLGNGETVNLAATDPDPLGDRRWKSQPSGFHTPEAQRILSDVEILERKFGDQKGRDEQSKREKDSAIQWLMMAKVHPERDVPTGQGPKVAAAMYYNYGVKCQLHAQRSPSTALEKSREAIDHYNTSIHNDSNYPAAYANRGLALATVGDLKSAINDYSTAISRDPKDSGTLNNRALAYIELRDYRSAGNDLSEALSIDPVSVKVLNSVAMLRSLTGNSQGAIDILRKLIKSGESLDTLYYNLAHIEASSGNKAQALKHYGFSIAVNPKYVFSWINRGTERYDLGQRLEARHDLREAVRIAPNFAPALYALGLVQYRDGENAAALSSYTLAIAADGKFAAALNGRAGIYKALGEISKAEKDYKAAVACGSVEALSNLGGLYSDARKFAQALPYFDRAIEAGFVGPDVYINRSGALISLDRYDEAFKDLREARPRALQAFPKESVDLKLRIGTIEYAYACAYGRQRNKKEALRHLQLAIGEVPGFKEGAQADADLAVLKSDPTFLALTR